MKEMNIPTLDAPQWSAERRKYCTETVAEILWACGDRWTSRAVQMLRRSSVAYAEYMHAIETAADGDPPALIRERKRRQAARDRYADPSAMPHRTEAAQALLF